MKQGEIYLADLNPVKGHEQGGYRPVLIIQNDALNKKLNTVIIAPITKNLKARGYLTTLFLSKKNTNLDFDSIALFFQVRTIDKARLKRLTAQIDQNLINQARKQLMLVF